jgi:Tfp pilus assembly protein PilN
MIKINLALKKQSVAAVEGGGEKGVKSATAALEGIKELPLKKIAIYVGLVFAANYLMQSTQEDELNKLDRKIARVNDENARLTAALGKTKQYEQLKASLDADETMIRQKLDLVKKLVDGRQNSSKMLLALSSGVPNEVWLSEFKVSDAEVRLKGLSSDFSHVSDFMKSLGESAYFGEMTLVNSVQDKDEIGLGVTNFELSAKRR